MPCPVIVEKKKQKKKKKKERNRKKRDIDYFIISFVFLIICSEYMHSVYSALQWVRSSFNLMLSGDLAECVVFDCLKRTAFGLLFLF